MKLVWNGYFTKRVLSQTANVWLFCDESGNIQSDPYLCIGMVKVVDNPALHEANLEEICLQHGLPDYREIKYSSTDRRTVPIRKAWIDYFFEQPDLRFKCLIRSRELLDLSTYDNEVYADRKMPKRAVAYNHSYRLALSNYVHDNEYAEILIDQRERRPDDNLLPYLDAHIPRCCSIEEIDSRERRLVQLADLLTGCLNGSLTGIGQGVKKEVHEYLLAESPLRSFSFNSWNPKFNLWHWRPNS